MADKKAEKKVVAVSTARLRAAYNKELAAALQKELGLANAHQVPKLEKITINDGSLLFVNREANTRMELNLAKAEAAGFLQEPVKLKASGTYQKLPMTLTLDGGSYENLKSSEEPYPLAFATPIICSPLGACA